MPAPIRFLRALLTGYGLRGMISRRVGGVVLVTLLLGSWLNYAQAASTVQTQADQLGRAEARTAAGQLDASLHTAAKIAMQPAALLEAIPTLTYAQQAAYLRHLLQVTPRVDTIDVFTYFEHKSYRDKTSQLWITRKSWPSLIYVTYNFHDPAQAAWYNTAKVTRRLTFTEPYFDLGGTNETLATVAAPILRGADYIGTAGVDIELNALSRVANNLHFGAGHNGSYGFLYSAQGNLIAYPDVSKLVGAHRNGQAVGTVDHGRFAALAHATSAAPVPVTLPGGAPALVYHERIPTAGWTLALVVPTSAIYAPLDGIRNQAIILTVASMIVILLLSVLTASSIVRPIEQVARAARRLAVGDTAVEEMLPSAQRNEIGVLADAFRSMAAHQQEMAALAGTIAHGDLSGTITPKDHKDVLGHAFAAMVTNLRDLVGHVAAATRQVDSGAEQLAQSSMQIGDASTQIARAIEEVARGAGEQSESATAAIAHMNSLAGAVAQVAEAADAQVAASEQAAATAAEGSAAVQRTIQSIEEARGAVQQSATQVQALSVHSVEIGHIVKAIDDIAEQTNLLALNAAIEAARAGEHGKGFTVVAAEVRKLAERSSNETKEITSRINTIQQQIEEVVAAMSAGSDAVMQSASLGADAGRALESILKVATGTKAQALAISDAVGQMRDGSERVASAMESIAAVSEQSAAGAEEVSASTEEQSAGVQEMAAGAQELARLAGELEAVIGRFQLAETEARPAPAAVLRAA